MKLRKRKNPRVCLERERDTYLRKRKKEEEKESRQRVGEWERVCRKTWVRKRQKKERERKRHIYELPIFYRVHIWTCPLFIFYIYIIYIYIMSIESSWVSEWVIYAYARDPHERAVQTPSLTRRLIVIRPPDALMPTAPAFIMSSDIHVEPDEPPGHGLLSLMRRPMFIIIICPLIFSSADARRLFWDVPFHYIARWYCASEKRRERHDVRAHERFERQALRTADRWAAIRRAMSRCTPWAPMTSVARRACRTVGCSQMKRCASKERYWYFMPREWRRRPPLCRDKRKMLYEAARGKESPPAASAMSEICRERQSESAQQDYDASARRRGYAESSACNMSERRWARKHESNVSLMREPPQTERSDAAPRARPPQRCHAFWFWGACRKEDNEMHAMSMRERERRECLRARDACKRRHDAREREDSESATVARNPTAPTKDERQREDARERASARRASVCARACARCQQRGGERRGVAERCVRSYVQVRKKTILFAKKRSVQTADKEWDAASSRPWEVQRKEVRLSVRERGVRDTVQCREEVKKRWKKDKEESGDRYAWRGYAWCAKSCDVLRENERWKRKRESRKRQVIYLKEKTRLFARREAARQKEECDTGPPRQKTRKRKEWKSEMRCEAWVMR